MKNLILVVTSLLIVTASSFTATTVASHPVNTAVSDLSPITGCGNFTERLNPRASDLPVGCGGCAKNGKYNISPSNCDLCKGYEHVYLLTHDSWGNQIGELNEQGVLVLYR